MINEKEKIAVIIPAYNEEVSIGSVILRTKKHAGKIIVVNDGSNDHTSEIAKLAGATVINHTENLGKGAALKTGFKAATNNGALVIVAMDADGQHNPDEIPWLAKNILTGSADIVIGSRYINGNGKNTPRYRRTGQTVLDKATNFNCKLNISDTQSGYRAFRSDIIDMFRFNNNGMGIESEMLMDAANAGLKIKEKEIHVRYDIKGSKKNPVKHGLQVLVRIIHDMELNRPLYYFTLPGIFLLTGGIIMGVHYIQLFRAGGQLPFGPALLFMMLLLLGTFSTFSGLILHSMSRLIRENKMINR